MLVFGHVGITTAAVKIFETAAFDNIDSTAYIDYRVVMLGSMLPDIIDKPLGEVLFKGLLTAAVQLRIPYYFR